MRCNLAAADFELYREVPAVPASEDEPLLGTVYQTKVLMPHIQGTERQLPFLLLFLPGQSFLAITPPHQPRHHQLALRSQLIQRREVPRGSRRRRPNEYCCRYWRCARKSILSFALLNLQPRAFVGANPAPP